MGTPLVTDEENTLSGCFEGTTPRLSTNPVNSSFYTIIGLIESILVLFTRSVTFLDIPNIASKRALRRKLKFLP